MTSPNVQMVIVTGSAAFAGALNAPSPITAAAIDATAIRDFILEKFFNPISAPKVLTVASFALKLCESKFHQISNCV